MRTVWAGGKSDPALNQWFARWACQRIFSHERGFGPCVTMAVFDSATLAAVMVYHNYEPDAAVIEITGAATDSRWLTRRVLKEMFSVPFQKMGCQSVVMRVSPDDKRLARMLHAYGFKSFRLPRLRGRGTDEMVFILHDDVWATNKFNRATDISRRTKDNGTNSEAAPMPPMKTRARGPHGKAETARTT